MTSAMCSLRGGAVDRAARLLRRRTTLTPCRRRRSRVRRHRGAAHGIDAVEGERDWGSPAENDGEAVEVGRAERYTPIVCSRSRPT
jgi:hypothetical protein